VGEVVIKIPPGVNESLLKKFLERDAELLLRAMKKRVRPGMLGKATVEELEEYAGEVGR